MRPKRPKSASEADKVGLHPLPDDGNLLFYVLGGGDLPPTPVASAPTCYLTRWGAFKAMGGIHMKGLNADPNDWNAKVSSAVVSYLPERLAVVTSSGRVYRLMEPPGAVDDRAERLAEHWLRRNGLQSDQVPDATSEVLSNLGISSDHEGLAKEFATRLKKIRRLEEAEARKSRRGKD